MPGAGSPSRHARLLGAGWIALALSLALAACAREESRNASPQRARTERERIVSLAPNVTEILFALNLGEALVGVTDYCNYPAAAAEKTRIGGFLNPNLEAIARLEPTLLIGLPGHRRAAPGLGSIEAEFLEVRNTSIAEILGSVRAIASRLDREARADSLCGGIEEALRAARARAAGREPRRVLIVTGRTPGEIRNVYAPGRGSFYDELLAAAGGVNVVETSKPLYPMLSLEEIVRADPEIIVELRPGAPSSPEALREIRAEWRALPDVRAVRRGHVEIWTEDYLMIPGPRLLLLLEKLERLVASLDGREGASREKPWPPTSKSAT